jgi:hypothetical protein
MSKGSKDTPVHLVDPVQNKKSETDEASLSKKVL